MDETRIASIDDACDFLRSFCGVDRDFPWSRPVDGLPPTLSRLGERLGAIWDGDGASHPYWCEPEPPMRAQHLFEVQDAFVDPRDYVFTAEEPVIFLVENQGVFSLGFRLGDDRLHVRGDWMDGGDRDTWRRLDDTSLEEAVITILLANLFWMSMSPDAIYVDPASRDPTLSRCIWSMPNWGFDGFWTNSTADRLFYSGIEKTVTRPVK